MQPINNNSLKFTIIEKPSLKIIPEDAQTEILSNLSLSTLGALSQTSKQFKSLCQPILNKQVMANSNVGKPTWVVIAEKLKTDINEKRESFVKFKSLRETSYCPCNRANPCDNQGLFLAFCWPCCSPCLLAIWLSTFPLDCYNKRAVNHTNQRLQTLIETDNQRLASLNAKVNMLQAPMTRQ